MLAAAVFRSEVAENRRTGRVWQGICEMVSATMRAGRKGRCDCYSHGANSEVNCGGYSKICDPGRPRREISGLHCFWWGHRKSHSDADAGEGSQRIGVEDEKSG